MSSYVYEGKLHSIEGNPFIIRFKSKIAIKNIIKFLHIFIKRLKFHHF